MRGASHHEGGDSLGTGGLGGAVLPQLLRAVPSGLLGQVGVGGACAGLGVEFLLAVLGLLTHVPGAWTGGAGRKDSACSSCPPGIGRGQGRAAFPTWCLLSTPLPRTPAVTTSHPCKEYPGAWRQACAPSHPSRACTPEGNGCCECCGGLRHAASWTLAAIPSPVARLASSRPISIFRVPSTRGSAWKPTHNADADCIIAHLSTSQASPPRPASPMSATPPACLRGSSLPSQGGPERLLSPAASGTGCRFLLSHFPSTVLVLFVLGVATDMVEGTEQGLAP